MARKPTPQERAFALGVTAGARRGREVEQEEAIRDVAAGLLAEDVTEAVGLLERYGNRALSYIATAARTVWPSRWKLALSPYILRLMRRAEITTDRGPVTLGFDVKSPKLAAYFDGYVDRLGRDLSETSRQNVEHVIREALDEGLSIPDTTVRLRERVGELNANRATLIAQNEIHRAAITASEIQARESKIVKSRTWLSASDNRVRPAHIALNGTTVGLDEPFPGDIQSPADEVRCRCTLVFNVDLEAIRGKSA